MSGSFSTAVAQSILKHLTGITSWTAPSALYLGLSTTDPGDTGSGITEPSGGSYARVSIGTGSGNWGVSGRVLSNSNTITFPTATANWGSVFYGVLYDASTSGNFLASGMLATSVLPFVAEAGSAGAISKFFVPGGSSIYVNNAQVVLQGVGSLPTGVSPATTYYVISTTSDNDEFQLSATQGGSAITLSSDGYGYLGLDGSQLIKTGNTLSLTAGQFSITLN